MWRLQVALMGAEKGEGLPLWFWVKEMDTGLSCGKLPRQGRP